MMLSVFVSLMVLFVLSLRSLPTRNAHHLCVCSEKITRARSRLFPPLLLSSCVFAYVIHVWFSHLCFVLAGTPIVNPPQSAILGMHGVKKRVVEFNGQVAIRPIMYIALTYDHRLIDGREAVLFLRAIKDNIEDPRRMLLEL